MDLVISFYELLDSGALTFTLLKVSLIFTLFHFLFKFFSLAPLSRFLWCFCLLFLAFLTLQSSFARDFLSWRKVFVLRKIEREDPEAIVEGKKLISLGVGDQTLFGELGLFLTQKQQASEAIIILEEGIKLFPKVSKLHLVLARALSNCGDFPRAIVHAREAILLTKNTYEKTWGFRTIIESYLAIGDKEKALSTLEELKTIVEGPEGLTLLNQQIERVKVTGKWK